jgi:hypothetical protein
VLKLELKVEELQSIKMPSWVWNEFISLGADRAKCKKCEEVVTRKNYGTSAMANHLKMKHKQFPPNSGESSEHQLIPKRPRQSNKSTKKEMLAKCAAKDIFYFFR